LRDFDVRVPAARITGGEDDPSRFVQHISFLEVDHDRKHEDERIAGSETQDQELHQGRWVAVQPQPKLAPALNPNQLRCGRTYAFV
jgi:hypothetical protein